MRHDAIKTSLHSHVPAADRQVEYSFLPIETTQSLSLFLSLPVGDRLVWIRARQNQEKKKHILSCRAVPCRIMYDSLLDQNSYIHLPKLQAYDFPVVIWLQLQLWKLRITNAAGSRAGNTDRWPTPRGFILFSSVWSLCLLLSAIYYRAFHNVLRDYKHL